MSKTLRVCLYRELPTLLERNDSFIYYAYDKLQVFIGQNLYTNHYAIVEKIPDNPVNGILYFVLEDGSVCIYSEYDIFKLADIESDEQLEILKQCGTTFFFNADRRYLDLQKRIITLPYRNGIYELSVNIANELKIDKDTVIGFNTETNEFEIIGNRHQYLLDFDPWYKGASTDSVENISENHMLKSHLKISQAYDNMLRLAKDGLYATGADKVTIKEFDNFRAYYNDYKSSMEGFIASLNSQIEGITDIVSPDALSRRITDTLNSIMPEIEEDISKYDELYLQIQQIEVDTKTYTDEVFQQAYDQIYEAIRESIENPWEDFGSTSEEETIDNEPVIVNDEEYTNDQSSSEDDDLVENNEEETSDNMEENGDTESEVSEEEIINDANIESEQTSDETIFEENTEKENQEIANPENSVEGIEEDTSEST